MPLKTAAPRKRTFFLITAIQYRLPLPVKEIIIFADGNEYPVCPRCDKSMPREYMNFCDRCGQRLDWRAYDTAAVVYAPRRNRT